MRILVVSTDYPPTLGGIAQVSHRTAEQFARQGHAVRVIAAGGGEAARAFDADQPFLTRRTPARHGWREAALLRAVRRDLRAFEPEVIWSASWYPGAVAVSYAVGRGGPLQTFSTYGSEIFVNRQGWKQRLKGQLGPLRRRVFSRAEVVFAISRYTREKIIEMGAPPARIRLAPGAVAESWFALERRPRPPEAGPILLTVARLDEHKGHDMVLRALPAVLARFPRARYVMVGPSDGNWPRLRALAEELGVLEAVDYRGAVSPAEVQAAYAEADVFVMPSREMPGRLDLVEGFGLTFLEAAAVGLPSVAGDSGGVPDAVEDGVSGLLVNPTSPEEISAALLRLLSEPEYARRLGEQGRARAAANFTWSAVAARMLAAFEEARADRARRTADS